MERLIRADPVVPGIAKGELLVSHEPLSFWGGYDHKTGEIIDGHHPLQGANAAGRILAVPFSRGSSTTTAVLLEALKAGTAPAAILISRHDSFFALASIVAEELFQKGIPVLLLDEGDFAVMTSGSHAEIEADGNIAIET